MKKLSVLLLAVVLLTACAPSPAPEGTQTDVASQVTDTSESSTNLGPIWARPSTEYYPPVSELEDNITEIYRFYEGNWYLEGYTDVYLTVSFDWSRMYISSFNYCFNKDVTYPLYAMKAGQENYLLELAEHTFEQMKADYGLSFEAGCIVLRGRRFYRDRKPRMTETECSAFVQPYLGTWYMEGHGDVSVVLSERNNGLVVIADNFSLRDRFQFHEHGAFTVYPLKTQMTSYVSAVTASYSNWEQELACHHLTFGENQITVGGYVFLRTQGTKTNDNS